MHIIWFLGGIGVGTVLGVIAVAICKAASDEDENMGIK